MKRFEAAGWAATRIDGHDPDAIAAAIERARLSDRPSLIACRTVIGFGAPSKAGTEKCHGSPLGADEIKGARDKLGWTRAGLRDSRRRPRRCGAPPASARRRRAHAWSQRLKALAADRRAEFERRIAGELPKDKLAAAVRAVKEKLTAAPKEIATRAASESALEALTAAVPEMIGGSADLTGSNNTKPKGMTVLSAADYGGRFIHYGVREHGMAAAMNGMALHRGVIPYSGTFLVFSDYCRPAIRLAALMGERVIHVMTHDSIGLGEDGPTHQPVEHLAALAGDPEPAGVPAVRRGRDRRMLAARARASRTARACSRSRARTCRSCGSATTRPTAAPPAPTRSFRPSKRAQVSLFASGSEVSIAVEARKFLRERGVAARVVSVPCFELFLALPAAERREIIGTRAGEGRGRGRGAAGLGRDHRLRRRLRRHDRLRRQRALQGTLPSSSALRPRRSPRRH